MSALQFTVLLRHPDYRNESGNETTLAHVAAADPAAAAEQARRDLDDVDSNGDDFAVLAVFAGHLSDLF